MTKKTLDPKLARLLDEGERFVILTHVNADGDGIGSSIGLYGFLQARGKNVRMIQNEPVMEQYRFLELADRIEVFEAGEMSEFIESADGIFVLDNGSMARLGRIEPSVRASSALKVCLDHHETSDDGWDVLVLDEKASATGEVVYWLFEAAGGAELTGAMAEALYVALITDSGHFRFSKTRPATHRMTAELLEHGVRPEKVYETVYHRQSEADLRLTGAALARLQLAMDDQLVWTVLDLELQKHLGALQVDTSGVINILLSLEAARVAMLLRELPDGKVKVSLRSRGTITIHGLAQRHGGGGHEHAAGLVMDGPPEEAARRLVEEARELFS